MYPNKILRRLAPEHEVNPTLIYPVSQWHYAYRPRNIPATKGVWNQSTKPHGAYKRY